MSELGREPAPDLADGAGREPVADADLRLGETLLRLLLSPRATLERLARQRTARPGASAIAFLATFWSMFLVLLWNAGEVPSMVLLPVAPGWYYLIEALAILPVLTALWWIGSELSHRVAVRLGGIGTEAGVRASLGFAYAAPMLVLVGCELGIYLRFGFEGLSIAARFALPLAGLSVVALSTAALKIAHRLPISRAALAALAGIVLNALAAGLLIR